MFRETAYDPEVFAHKEGWGPQDGAFIGSFILPVDLIYDAKRSGKGARSFCQYDFLFGGFWVLATTLEDWDEVAPLETCGCGACDLKAAYMTTGRTPVSNHEYRKLRRTDLYDTSRYLEQTSRGDPDRASVAITARVEAKHYYSS
jgi:hypothetical protein